MRWMLAAGALVASLAVLAGSAQAGSGQAQRSGRSAVNALDVSWLHTSLQGDKFEVIGGRVALRHSFSPSVRALAQRLIRDHSKSYAEGAAIARRIGVKVPDEPTPTEGWELRMLMQHWGSSFDRMYTTLEVSDHHQDIEETTDEIERGWNSAVKNAAKSDLPVLEMHLRLSRAARNAVL